MNLHRENSISKVSEQCMIKFWRSLSCAQILAVSRPFDGGVAKRPSFMYIARLATHRMHWYTLVVSVSMSFSRHLA